MTNLLNIRSVIARLSLRFMASFAVVGLAITHAATAAPSPPPPGDATKGKVVFAKCAICHSVAPGQNRLGPTLAGVIGRKPGSVPNYNYSPAMQANSKPWTAAQLDIYLANPRSVVPGTKMIFAGLPQPIDRADVIAYLNNPAAAK